MSRAIEVASRSRSDSTGRSPGVTTGSQGSYGSSSLSEYYQKHKKTTLTQEEEEMMNQKRERFQTCKEVIDRLHWDESLADVLSNLSMIYKGKLMIMQFVH